jgi:hypothetical protein
MIPLTGWSRDGNTASRINEKLGYRWQDGRKVGKQLPGQMRCWYTAGRMNEKLGYSCRMNEKLGYS